MSEILLSELLEKMIEQAKSYGSREDTALTAEKYLVAVIDILRGTAQIEMTQEDKNALASEWESHIPEEHSLEELRTVLMTHIEEKNEGYNFDGLYTQQCLLKAKAQAKSAGVETVSPAVLLNCILEEPSDFIKSCCTSDSQKHAGDTQVGKDAGKSREEYNKSLSFLFGDKQPEKEKKEQEKEKEPVTQKEPELPQSPELAKEAVAKLTEKTKEIHDKLMQSVFGQDNAISIFSAGYFQAELLALTDKNRTCPRATFLFAGPPGVGKTFLAENAADVLELPYQRFDMSEYADNEAIVEFCGSDNVYKNGKQGNVTSFVAKHSHCVLLFDEIEKAHISIIHLFLQILDAGRIRDNYTDKEVSFSNAYIFFTTNAGRQLYEDSDTSDFSSVTRKVILKALQNDVRPDTGTPFFPAAICSRFASGNVVMFNYITAHNLRKIAKKEVLRHSTNFENEVGIRVPIDEPVFTALLFAEGGAADARTIRSRAESFFDDELFELFRLIESDNVNADIRALENIHISAQLPIEQKEVYELFVRDGSYEVLVFAAKKQYEDCVKASPETGFFHAQTMEEAKSILNERDISFVLLDMTFGASGNATYLNIEDTDSESRDFFAFLREALPDLPVYLLQTEAKILNSEEKLSFMRRGARGVMSLAEGKEAFAAEIVQINEQLHQQKSMIKLAKANKLISYETAQLIHEDGKTAEIKLFDFKTKVAIDAEDSENILSSVSKPDVNFDQVIGAEDAKTELQYFVDYLKNPKKFMGTGVSAPKGVLLYGPPGTGKTMLAKAMASESDVTFITAEGNQFVNKYQGEGKEKVKELFRTARKYAPSILFIDEIDAIAKERTGGEHSADLEVTLTAFLAEMDGFKNDATKPVFVLAATNFEVEPGSAKSLDPALMRRFDRRIYVDLPTREERIRFMHNKFEENAAFEVSEEKINNIAIRSTGMSLAELASTVELSLRTAIRDGNFKVTDEIFEEAFETFNGGEVKQWDASQLERVTRHEAGHAFLCWQSGETPSYVTVVARGDHGGYMRHDDQEGKMVYTKDELLSNIRTALGGRAAEIVYYGEKDGVSSGAAGDLVAATSAAKQLICAFGMDEAFGLAVITPQEIVSGELATEVRAAVNQILSQQMAAAIESIEKNKAAVDALVKRLLSENHLAGEEIVKVFESVARE